MARLQGLLSKFEEGANVERINGRPDAARVAAIADMQGRYDHLAGVPKVSA